jgi:hypothetical protein
MEKNGKIIFLGFTLGSKNFRIIDFKKKENNSGVCPGGRV